jgi:osmotically-inducible protein OsmY
MNKKYSRLALNCLAVIAVSASLFACSKHDEVVIPVVEDGTLTSNVKAALAADPILRGSDLKVVARAGVVELSGTFDSYPAIDRALALARGVTGVKSVDDKTVKKEDAAAAAAAAPTVAPAAAAAPAADLPALPAAHK